MIFEESIKTPLLCVGLLVSFCVSCVRSGIPETRFAEMEKYARETMPAVRAALEPALPTCILEVSDQPTFEAMQENLLDAVASGEKSIQVNIAEGFYYFDEDHLDLSGLDAPGVDISIRGEGAVLLGKGNDFAAGENPFPGRFSWENGWVRTEDMSPVNLFGAQHFRFAEGLVEMTDSTRRSCRIAVRNEPVLSEAECSDLYILMTQWYMSSIYRVDRVGRDTVWFTPDTLRYNSWIGGTNLNFDYEFTKHKKFGRYKWINLPSEDRLFVRGDSIHVPVGMGPVHECRVSRFLQMKGSRIRTLNIRGLRFAGNNGIRELISLDHCALGSFSLSDNVFCGIRGTLFQACSCDGLHICGNQALECSKDGFCFDNGCSQVEVKGNAFRNMDQWPNFHFSVICEAEDFHIADNTFEDFGYSAIRAGFDWRDTPRRSARGIIERNYCSFSKEYFEDYAEHMLMDSGAINAFCKSGGILIRHNVICNFTGNRRNRGIFCDDGCNHVILYGNLIWNIPNDHDIDSRNVPGVERDSMFMDHNVGNVMLLNLLAGSYRAEGKDSLNRMVKGMQIRLGSNDATDEVSNCDSEADFVIAPAIPEYDCVRVPRRYRRALKRRGIDPFVLGYLR